MLSPGALPIGLEAQGLLGLAVQVGVSTYIIIAAIHVVAGITSWFSDGVCLRGL